MFDQLNIPTITAMTAAATLGATYALRTVFGNAVENRALGKARIAAQAFEDNIAPYLARVDGEQKTNVETALILLKRSDDMRATMQAQAKKMELPSIQDVPSSELLTKQMLLIGAGVAGACVEVVT